MSVIQERLRGEGLSWRALNRLTNSRLNTVVEAAFIPAGERTVAQERTIVNVKALEEKRKRRVRGANAAQARVNGSYLQGGQPRGFGRRT